MACVISASLVCLAVFLTSACLLCDADTSVEFVRLKAKKKGRVRFTATCSYSLSETVTGNAVFEINLGTPISGFQSQDVRLLAEEGNVTRVEVKRRKLRPPTYNVTFSGSYVGDAEAPPNGTCSSLQTPATLSPDGAGVPPMSIFWISGMTPQYAKSVHRNWYIEGGWFRSLQLGNCLPGWREFGYSCLLVRQGERDWPRAQTDCWLAKDGAFLTQLTTKSKSDFVKKMITDAGLTTNGVWIGGWNLDGFFMWTDTTPFSETFTDWLPGRPRSVQRRSAVAMILPEMQWLDSDQYASMPGVCEYCYR